MKSAFLLIVFTFWSAFAQEEVNLCKRKPYLALCQDEASSFENSRQNVEKIPKGLGGKADVTIARESTENLARKKREISTDNGVAVEERRKALLEELKKLDETPNDVRRQDSSDYYRYSQSQGCANPCVYPYGSYGSGNYYNGGGYSQYYPSSSYGSSSSYYPYYSNNYYPYSSGSGYGGYPGYYSSGAGPFNLGLGSGLNIGIPGLPGGFGIGSGFGVTVGKR